MVVAAEWATGRYWDEMEVKVVGEEAEGGTESEAANGTEPGEAERGLRPESIGCSKLARSLASVDCTTRRPARPVSESNRIDWQI